MKLYKIRQMLVSKWNLLTKHDNEIYLLEDDNNTNNRSIAIGDKVFANNGSGQYASLTPTSHASNVQYVINGPGNVASADVYKCYCNAFGVWNKMIDGDGISITYSDGCTTFSVDAASANAIGGIKTGYSDNNKNYAVQLDAYNKAFVHVPWEYGVADDNKAGLVPEIQPTDDVSKSENNVFLVCDESRTLRWVKTSRMQALLADR